MQAEHRRDDVPTRFIGRSASNADVQRHPLWSKAPECEKKGGIRRLFRSCRCSLALLGLAVREFFADARRLAGPVSQVVQLRSPHVSLALDFDAGDQWRIRLERALHAFAAGNFPYDER